MPSVDVAVERMVEVMRFSGMSLRVCACRPKATVVTAISRFAQTFSTRELQLFRAHWNGSAASLSTR